MIIISRQSHDPHKDGQLTFDVYPPTCFCVTPHCVVRLGSASLLFVSYGVEGDGDGDFHVLALQVVSDVVLCKTVVVAELDVRGLVAKPVRGANLATAKPPQSAEQVCDLLELMFRIMLVAHCVTERLNCSGARKARICRPESHPECIAL